MGIDTTRFMVKVEKDLICMICGQVLKNPVQVELIEEIGVPSCSRIFCKDCLHFWRRLRANECRDAICPNCQTNEEICELTEKGYNESTPEVLRRKGLIDEMPIGCDFGYNGCPEVVAFRLVSSHVYTCPPGPDKQMVCETCDKLLTKSIVEEVFLYHSCLKYLKEVIVEKDKVIDKQVHIINSLDEKLKTEAVRIDVLVKQLIREEMMVSLEFKESLDDQDKGEDLDSKQMMWTVNLSKEEQQLDHQMSSALQMDSNRPDRETSGPIRGQYSDQRQSSPSVAFKSDLKSRVKNIVSCDNFRDFILYYSDEEKTVNRFNEWEPHIKEGLKVLYDKMYVEGRSLAFEWVFLALMLGPKGHVTFNKPSKQYIEEVEKSYSHLLASGRISFAEEQAVFTNRSLVASQDIIRATETNSNIAYKYLKAGANI